MRVPVLLSFFFPRQRGKGLFAIQASRCAFLFLTLWDRRLSRVFVVVVHRRVEWCCFFLLHGTCITSVHMYAAFFFFFLQTLFWRVVVLIMRWPCFHNGAGGQWLFFFFCSDLQAVEHKCVWHTSSVRGVIYLFIWWGSFLFFVKPSRFLLYSSVFFFLL